MNENGEPVRGKRSKSEPIKVVVQYGEPMSEEEVEQLEDDLVDLLLAMHAKEKAECAAKTDVGPDSPQDLSK